MAVTPATFVLVLDHSILVTIVPSALHRACDLLHRPWGKGWLTIYFDLCALPYCWCDYHLHCKLGNIDHIWTVSFLAQQDCCAILKPEQEATYSLFLLPALLDLPSRWSNSVAFALAENVEVILSVWKSKVTGDFEFFILELHHLELFEVYGKSCFFEHQLRSKRIEIFD